MELYKRIAHLQSDRNFSIGTAGYGKMEMIIDTPSAEQIAEATVTGTIEDVSTAMDYILGDYFSYDGRHKRYSESTLRALLDDSNPIVMIRGYYENTIDWSGIN